LHSGEAMAETHDQRGAGSYWQRLGDRITATGKSIVDHPFIKRTGEICEAIGKLGLLFAVFGWLFECSDRAELKHAAAWSLINSGHGKPGSAGRIEALESLAGDNVSLAGIDLSGGSFPNVDLRSGDLFGANLNATNLVGATFGCRYWIYGCSRLKQVDFGKSDFSKVDFSGADLSNSTFEASMASDVNFKGARLVGTTFKNVVLSDPDFSEARIYQTVFAGVKIYIERQDAAPFRNSMFGFVDLARMEFILVRNGSSRTLGNAEVLEFLKDAVLCGAKFSDGLTVYRKCPNIADKTVKEMDAPGSGVPKQLKQ
jgi:uncharacterized protein YjbI with pentapeptide repeats